jgi:hypothetical protein
MVLKGGAHDEELHSDGGRSLVVVVVDTGFEDQDE